MREKLEEERKSRYRERKKIGENEKKESKSGCSDKVILRNMGGKTFFETSLNPLIELVRTNLSICASVTTVTKVIMPYSDFFVVLSWLEKLFIFQQNAFFAFM